MKKSLLLAVFGIFALAGVATAQDNTAYRRVTETRHEQGYNNERNRRDNASYTGNDVAAARDRAEGRPLDGRGGFGIRGGLNLSSVTDLNTKAGFHLGAMYDRRIARRAPLFMETGLYVQYKGGKENSGGFTNEMNMWYLQIPVVLNYHIRIAREWTIQPQLGLYYALGVGGKWKPAGQSYDLFNDYLKRSDFGLRVGVGATWRRMYLGVGYDAGLIDIAQSKLGTGNLKTKNFYVTVGYNF